jgi:hypothetical protein
MLILLAPSVIAKEDRFLLAFPKGTSVKNIKSELHQIYTWGWRPILKQ